MSKPFDYHTFDRQLGNLVSKAKGKSFIELAGEIETLRRQYKGVRSESAMKYIRRTLGRWLLIFAIDSLQAEVIVDRLYKRNVRQGFNGFHGEVASALEYADYCSERGQVSKGLRALYKVRKKLTASDALPRDRAQNFVQPIEKLIRRLEHAAHQRRRRPDQQRLRRQRPPHRSDQCPD
jgi:hypothetical protein